MILIGFRIPLKKSCFLITTKRQMSLPPLFLEVARPCRTRKYKYLGLRHRIRQGKTVIQQLNSLLWSTKLRSDTKKLRVLYNCTVGPITTYSAEYVEVTQNEKQRLQTVEMIFFRRSCRVSRLKHIYQMN